MPEAGCLKITVLGSGTSVGVPTIGCHCAVCTSSDPRDKRLRPSVLLSYGGHNVVIDTTPDFRSQALRAGLEHLDAIVFTHAHADHIMGLDDVRPFNYRQQGGIPVYGAPETIEAVRRVFAVHFRRSLCTIPTFRISRRTCSTASRSICSGFRFRPVPLKHGRTQVYGYRFGAGRLPDGPQRYSGRIARSAARIWTCFSWTRSGYKPHPTHTTVARALEYVAELKPRRAFFTHICHDLAHEETERALPAHVRLAYDGLEIRGSMTVYRDLAEYRTGLRPVGRDYRQLRRRACRAPADSAARRGAGASSGDGRPSVLTFDPHPALVVAPERAPLCSRRPKSGARTDAPRKESSRS